MWQRLRAARKHAGLTQLDIAKACIPPVSRGAVAQWESAKPENRNSPSVLQLSAISDATGVPVTWFLDDQSDVMDLIRDRNMPLPAAHLVKFDPAPRLIHHRDPVPLSKRLELFVGAVRYEVMNRSHEAAENFDPAVRHGPLPIRVDYLSTGTVAKVVSRPTAEDVGLLLLTEKLEARRLRKVLLVWDLVQSNVREAAAHFITDFLGSEIELHHVCAPAQAAEIILSVA